MTRDERRQGFMYFPGQLDAEVRIPEGRAISGASIGILVLDLGYPYLPGNVANASTYRFPVRFNILRGSTIPQILSHDRSLLDMIVAGGRELIKDGVRAIVGACGYFGYYQKEAAAALEVPVFLSSLLQISIIKQTLKADQQVGVICAHYESLSKETLAACGVDDPSELVIVGAQDLPEFKNIINCTLHYNPAQLEKELTELAVKLARDNPQIGAFLLECSDMPPFSWAIQNATGLPVFDFITMIKWIHSAVVQTPYHGFM
ncbi:MAG: aspartate/glutamate racemase family protein [Desulfobacterales bacterium]